MELLGRFPASLVYRGKVGCPCSRLQCITLYADVGLAWLLGEAPMRCLLSPVQRASRNLPTGTPTKRKPSRRRPALSGGHVDVHMCQCHHSS